MKSQESDRRNLSGFVDNIEIKTEKPDPNLREIVISNSDEEEEQNSREEIDILNSFKEKTNQKIKERPNLNKKHLISNSLLRGLLPNESCKWYSRVSNLPIVKRCCIEHCYFVRNRGGTSRYNLRNLPAGEGNTLQFQNENRLEQQTIDFESATTPKKVNSVLANDSVDELLELNDKKKSNWSSCNSDTGDSVVDDSNDKDYSPEENSTGTDSENDSVECDESGNVIKQIWNESGINSDRSDVKTLKNVSGSDEHKKSNWRNRLGISSYPNTNKIPNNFVSVHDLLAKIKKMQKLMKAKYEKKFVSDSDNIPPPKLKRMISRGKSEDFTKMTEYFFPMPNLTKMSGGNKNWRVDYIDDDVQSLGLDDLLLKASELNAENFTKALGRKLDLVKSNFNTKDSSEIVLTIPKSKRNSVDSKQSGEINECEFSKRSNLKSVKLDFSNSFVESDKRKEAERIQNVSKIPEETSPKKPGIKVKTVENINEEFKDSLELKKKVFKDSNAGILEKSVLEGRKDLSVVVRNKSPLKEGTAVQKSDKSRNSQDEPANKDDEDSSRPFIMTIVQGKTEKQRPAILRNSSYFKKKSNGLDSSKSSEKITERTRKERESNLRSSTGENLGESETAEGGVPDGQSSKFQNSEQNGLNLSTPLSGESLGGGFYPKVLCETDDDISNSTDNNSGKMRFQVKKKNIPFILNHSRKSRQADISGRGSPIASGSSNNKLVKGNEAPDKLSSEKVLKVTSVEQKLGPKEANRRFIKVVPYEPASKSGKMADAADLQQKNSDEDSERGSSGTESKSNHVLSLSAFSAILKEILPDKWHLCLDKKYGLQIIKTHIDEVLNPSILMSVVIGRCGKLTVNVRGKQLEKSHQLFSNLCNIGNSENKLSLNYVLAILNKLRYLSVCFGCDPSLKKYLTEEVSGDCQSQIQQVYRSHLCHLLVSLGKKRCYPCYRMNESLKKRSRRDKMEGKSKEEIVKDPLDLSEAVPEVGETEVGKSSNVTTRGVKRNLEDFLEESFSTMKQQIVDEIEKNKKLGERENALKAQEEVLSFMGLTRKDSLGNSVRKSKRKKTSFYKSQQPVKKKIDQKELEFLEKYWTDINTLFSTSLLFGAYSRTGRSRLREKCRMFHKLLSTWREIVKTNPEWIGGEIILPDNCTVSVTNIGKKNYYSSIYRLYLC